MGKPILLILAVGLLGFFAGRQQQTAPTSKPSPQFLFVQTAPTGQFDGSTLSLELSGPYATIFSDRPYREAGRMTHEDFLRLWNEGQDDFAEDPPNAAVVFLLEGHQREAVVELHSPTLDGTTLSYQTSRLHGDIPLSTPLQQLSVFIDDAKETEIGNSPFDLKTNSAIQRRIVNHGNGNLSSVWTYNNANNWNTRGSGYNFYNGNSWGSSSSSK